MLSGNNVCCICCLPFQNIAKPQSFKTAMESEGTLPEIQNTVHVGTGRITASKNPGKIRDMVIS